MDTLLVVQLQGLKYLPPAFYSLKSVFAMASASTASNIQAMVGRVRSIAGDDGLTSLLELPELPTKFLSEATDDSKKLYFESLAEFASTFSKDVVAQDRAIEDVLHEYSAGPSRQVRARLRLAVNLAHAYMDGKAVTDEAKDIVCSIPGSTKTWTPSGRTLMARTSHRCLISPLGMAQN